MGVYVFMLHNDLIPVAPQHPFLLCCSTSGSPGVASQGEVHSEF